MAPRFWPWSKLNDSFAKEPQEVQGLTHNIRMHLTMIATRNQSCRFKYYSYISCQTKLALPGAERKAEKSLHDEARTTADHGGHFPLSLHRSGTATPPLLKIGMSNFTGTFIDSVHSYLSICSYQVPIVAMHYLLSDRIGCIGLTAANDAITTPRTTRPRRTTRLACQQSRRRSKLRT